MSLIIEIISTIILSIGEISSLYNLSKTKPKKRGLGTYLIIMFMVVIQIINYHYIIGIIKSIIIVLMFFLICFVFMKKNIKESLVISFITEMLIIILETLLLIVLNIIFKINFELLGNIYISSLFDCLVSTLLYIITRYKIFSNLVKQLKKSLIFSKVYYLIILFLFVMLGIGSIFTSLYLKEQILLSLVINVICLIIYAFIIILVFKYQDKYYRINLKYNNSLENLDAQEAIIENYRVINHENKNHLLTIKAMSKNKKINDYVDSLIKEKSNYNDEIIKETIKLPTGGMRGLIYSKMIYMKEKNINCNLNIDKRITSKLLSSLSDNDIIDICNILGVFIDNAIEATLNQKNNSVSIQISFVDKKINIDISNNYDNRKIKYKNDGELKTTKGISHGYGLQLVKRIVSSNNKLKNERYLSKDIFMQKLIIKI